MHKVAFGALFSWLFDKSLKGIPPPKGRLQERVGMLTGFSLQGERAANFIICLGCLNEGKDGNWFKDSPRPASKQQPSGSKQATQIGSFRFSKNFCVNGYGAC